MLTDLYPNFGYRALYDDETDTLLVTWGQTGYGHDVVPEHYRGVKGLGFRSLKVGYVRSKAVNVQVRSFSHLPVWSFEQVMTLFGKNIPFVNVIRSAQQQLLALKSSPQPKPTVPTETS